MKRIGVIILTVCMLLAMTACGSAAQENTEDASTATFPRMQPAETQTVPVETTQETYVPAQEVLDYLTSLYPQTQQTTPEDYYRLNFVSVGGEDFDVIWSADVDAGLVRALADKDNQALIDVNEECKQDTQYMLTATVTDRGGNTMSCSWSCVLPQGIPDYMEAYEDLIGDYKKIVKNRLAGNYDLPSNTSRTLEKAMAANPDVAGYNLGNMAFELYYDGEASVKDYGYILFDLNKDKVPELFWVQKDYTIAAIFTFVNDRAVLVDAYWSRYYSYISQSGQLWAHGSSGAADNSTVCYKLSSKGKLVVDYGYATESNWENEACPVNYYKIKGSKRTLISDLEYSALVDQYPSGNGNLWYSQTIHSL